MKRLHSFLLAAMASAALQGFSGLCVLAQAQTGGGGSKPVPGLKVDFVLSEPCSLIAFLDILSRRHNTSTWVREWYEKKRPAAAAPQDNAMIALYRGVMDGDTNHAEFVDQTGRQLDLDQKTLCLAADSTSLDELFLKFKEVVDDKQYQDMKKAVEYYSPIYHEMIWLPRLPALQKQLEEHKQETVNSKMCEMLDEVKSFMQAPWVPGLAFKVVLAPLPYDGKHKHGESMGRVQIVELRPADQFAKSADVVFHEACHALWFSKKDLSEADSQFVTAGGEHVPLTEIYESMATALAQGCFAQNAFGKTSPSWYHDKVIDQYSHRVVKLYAQYLNSGRPIDPTFCRLAAEIFFELYPDANRDMRLISEFLVLQEDIPDLEKLKTDVYKALPRIRGCSICSPIDADESIKIYNEFKRPNVTVLTTAAELQKLSCLGITKNQLDLLKKATEPVTLQVEGKQVLFCIADTPAAQQKLLFQCLKKSKWPQPRA